MKKPVVRLVKFPSGEPRIEVGERLLVRSKSNDRLIVRSCDFLVEIKETRMVTREAAV